MLNSIEEHIKILIYRSTYIFFASTGLLQADILVRPLQEVLVHCRLKIFFLRISDFKGDVSSCVGRLKSVLFAWSEKGVCRQYRPSPLCASCIYLPVVGEYGCGIYIYIYIYIYCQDLLTFYRAQTLPLQFCLCKRS